MNTTSAIWDVDGPGKPSGCWLATSESEIVGGDAGMMSRLTLGALVSTELDAVTAPDTIHSFSLEHFLRKINTVAECQYTKIFSGASRRKD
uniref:Uncharacterized protein n=1 Tax=Romanomermis culicivorax TaxID=13658 RepID=A0A915HS72_ROMCU